MKDFIHNISDTKLKKAVLIIIAILLLNFLITIITGRNIIASAYNYLANLVTGYNSEVKMLVIKSPDFDSNTQGSYKITKQTDWTDTYKAEVNLKISSKAYYNQANKDVIFVLDNSIPVCNDTNRNIINTMFKVITNRNDQAAIVTFDKTAYIKNPFSSNYDELSNIINNLTCSESNDNNYYDALLQVSSLLENSSKTKDIQVVFITDGYPNINTPNEVGEYEIIKSKYPNVTIDAIQYNLGSDVISEIDSISDNVYIVDNNNFNNVLNQVIIKPVSFDYFEVREYLDDNYYTFTDNYETSKGTVSITTENNKPVLIWRIDADFLSGNDETLSYEIEVISNKKDSIGFYPINTNTKVLSRLNGMSTYEQNDSNTLVLKAGYDVNIDANIPSNCSDTYTDNLKYYYSSQVTKPTNVPTCEGYIFRGWEIVEKDVQNINDEKFFMPTHDVNIKGTWSRLSIEKSMEGTIALNTTLYRAIASMAVADNNSSDYVSSSSGINFKNTSSDSNGKGVYTISSTLDNTYPIHYFRGDVNDNNVIFGGFCWKILRTTDTGGVKLVYNGAPTNGTCNGIVSSTKINTGSINPPSLADIGYMYNPSLSFGDKWVNNDWYLMYNLPQSWHGVGASGSTYYYGKTATYSNGVYTITDGELYLWKNNYQKLNGYVTCFTSSNQCSKLYSIHAVSPDYAYSAVLQNGQTVEALKADAAQKYFVFGDSITYNSSNKTYTLNNSKRVYHTELNSSKITNNRYTCFTTTNSCTEVNYIYRVDDGNQPFSGTTSSYTYSQMNYIKLQEGNTLEKFLNNAVNSPNTNSSPFKDVVDNWYKTNLLSYEDYLEDTIFCNDRTIFDYAGFNPLGNIKNQLIFANRARMEAGTPTLSCPLNDSFSKTNIGNGKLTYPVGLISSDEAIYAGYNFKGVVNTYLTSKPPEAETDDSIRYSSFTMSPMDVQAQYLGFAAINAQTDYLEDMRLNVQFSLRPVVSLKNLTEYVSGDGTMANPYIIN